MRDLRQEGQRKKESEREGRGVAEGNLQGMTEVGEKPWQFH